MRKVIIAALLVGGAATPALAQERGAFEGPRVEALAGYDAVKAGDQSNSNPLLVGGKDKAEGVTYGVRGGYDFDLGTVVAGLDAEITGTTADIKNDAAGTDVEFGRDLYVGGRLGVKVTPSTLVYAGAGYTNGAVKTSHDLAGGEFSTKGKADGYRLSAGAEQLLGPNSFGRLEYRYSDYGKYGVDNDPLGRSIDLNRHQVVASVGVRF